MTELPVTPEQLELANNYKEMPNWKSTSPFCVDGRTDKDGSSDGLYPQALGGSLNAAVIDLFRLEIYQKGSFNESLGTSFAKLADNGFALGVHCDDHEHTEGGSGCGFADNLGTIINVLATHHEAIGEVLGYEKDDQVWKRIKEKVEQVKATVEFPKGNKTINSARDFKGGNSVSVQKLSGNHGEIVAFVNYQEAYTLDTKDTNKSGKQGFNLDMWYVQKMADALGVPAEESEFVEKLTLGLYLATEMVLVERVHEPENSAPQKRLPIVIKNQQGELQRAA